MAEEEEVRMIVKTSMHTPDIIITNGTDMKKVMGELLMMSTDPTSPMYISSKYFTFRLLECIRRVLMDEKSRYRPKGSCPFIFDSWSCWNATAPGAYQTEPCPDMPNLAFRTDRSATKFCTGSGNWWVHPESNKSWSNYTNCLDKEDASFLLTINQVSVAGLSVSLAALIPSLLIFSLPSLKCTRNSIHKNMFSSIALNNIAWILWYNYVLSEPSVWHENWIWCQALQSLTTYLMLTTYSWMLCEGAYLRFILVRTVLDEDRWLFWLKALGWGLPILPMLPYIAYRVMYENQFCWMDQGNSVYFLAVPSILTILINIFFLVSVVKVIRSKLHFENNFNRNHTDPMMKSAKAVIILVPIFGIHFVLLPMRPVKDSSLEYPYEIASCLSTSLQGFFISILLCFANPEVSSLIRKKSSDFLRETLRLLCKAKRNENLRLEMRKPKLCRNKTSADSGVVLSVATTSVRSRETIL